MIVVREGGEDCSVSGGMDVGVAEEDLFVVTGGEEVATVGYGGLDGV